MAKAELKTKVSSDSVQLFIDKIADPKQKEDSKLIVKLLQDSTKSTPKMWGSSIVGFIDTVIKYENGRELEWFKIGFSPRKQALTLYGLSINEPKNAELLSKLGKFSTGKGCVYVKKLEDVDQNILKQLVKNAIE